MQLSNCEIQVKFHLKIINLVYVTRCLQNLKKHIYCLTDICPVIVHVERHRPASGPTRSILDDTLTCFCVHHEMYHILVMDTNKTGSSIVRCGIMNVISSDLISSSACYILPLITRGIVFLWISFIQSVFFYRKCLTGLNNIIII